ncbi:MAG: exodeoxyribonuclease III [Fimbriimonadaceae bacterium]|nr:exodeoxyribonuclease III [Fimbriimonadaceae bacterium]
MKVATFNVNSLRARLPVVRQWLELVQPDVVGLQELKCEDDKFPYKDLEDLGYHMTVYGQKSYNGVAFLSRMEPTDVERGFHNPEMPSDARLIAATFDSVRIINSYCPNGTALGSEKFAYKLRWFEEFRKEAANLTDGGPCLWMGDINIAPTDLDVFEPEKKANAVGFQPEEKSALMAITDLGWTDLFRQQHPEEDGLYTFWEYVIPNGFKRNLGWRIDHIYANPAALPGAGKCWIDKEPRTWERPSDHTPLLLEWS